MEIYKYSIDRGGYFGIICVFLLLFFSIYLRFVIKRKENSESLFKSLLSFVRLFTLIALIGVGANYIINALKEINTVKSLVVASTNAIKINPEKIVYTIEVNENYKIQFNRDTTFCFIESKVSPSTGLMKIDTIFSSNIYNIKQITVYTKEPKLVFEFKQPNESSAFKYNKSKSNRLSTLQYLYRLNNMGFDFKVNIQPASLPLIFACSLFLLMFVSLLAVPFKRGPSAEQGCLIAFICMVVIFMLLAYLYGAAYDFE